MKESTEIHGYCDQRFLAVKDAFAGNFESGLEVGASFAVTLDSEYVVDLWAGHADAAQTMPWERNTITNVYSTTKVMTTLCALMLVDRGQLDLDSAVADYWPEFAQGGKSEIIVRWLLSHSAGLAGINEPLPMEALYDWGRITEILARQEPWWQPGTQSGYHMVTFGYLVGELVRRISGKTLGSFFRDEVSVPLGADFHIGLRREHDARVAELIPPPPMEPPVFDPESFAARTLFNPPIIPGYSDRAWRAAEIPSSNGHGNARSAARVGSLLACGGQLDGLRLLSQATIDHAIEEQYNGTDVVLGAPVRYGLGFGLVNEALPCLSPRSFYWGGFGGSWLEMDPDSRLCFSYVMNKLEANPGGDVRMIGLRNAVMTAMQSK
ncbi:EstA family serine hydrolase [Desulfomonile tiedjei]|uniref:Penicillin-binding protein, beta-lactamase class C n=1 Tax=Desulfomonile tiedjei (strain ATCC 49306 / DSM 6799 / DCB-1) TaxID=706587 RepID=I4C584_DESTA|nr:EstA family serine hydrolase [Desulfomonile tiedjei]AFM24725.1 penicillin-binding protein, beta-lactamase class C [Desulfomonile tiedjei DSM 6799]